MTKSATREAADGELFKSTGIDDNATSTAVTIDASENVGIGTASPSARFEVEDNGSSTGGVIMKVTQDDQGSHYGMSVGNDAYSTVDTDGFVVYQMDNGHTYLYNGGVDEGPNIGMPVAGGITFGTDTAAANTLDDYEEGTWTPALVNGTNVPAGTSITTVTYASYTKIGRQVNAYLYCDGMNFNSSGATFQIAGLPFAPKGGQYGGGSIGYTNTFNVATKHLQVLVHSNSLIYFHKGDGGSAAATNADFAGCSYMLLNVNYITDA
jgi:hypothetical protein